MYVTCHTSINYCRIVSSVVVVTKICMKLNDIDDYESVTSTRCWQAAIQSTNMYSPHTHISSYIVWLFILFTLCSNLELEIYEMLFKCLWLIETAVRNSVLVPIIFLWHIAKTPCRGSCFLSLYYCCRFGFFLFCDLHRKKKFTYEYSVIRENNWLLYPKMGGNILFIVTVNIVCTCLCVWLPWDWPGIAISHPQSP